MALPMLEAMVSPVSAIAAGAAAKAAPKRMAFVYVPNGVIMEQWTPSATGTNYELPEIVSSLKPLQKDFSMISGLAHVKARGNGDGAGDHARASATFLTGCQARKTAGADIKIGVSVDQLAAEKLGRETRLASLELTCDRGRQAGACDSGYSCAYQFNVSWKTEATPMPPEVDPKLVFERLFGGGSNGESAEGRARRDLYKKSILDFVLDDAKRLKANLGATDQRKLDEYLSAVREVETRIEQSAKYAVVVPADGKTRNMPKDYNYEQHLRLMYDLMALAFQTDSTRVATFINAHDGSNRSYPFIGVSDGHHDLSHHREDKEKIAKIAKINIFHVEQFAYFLEKLKSIKEGEGTLLDNSMIVYGSGISDGNRHNHANLPVILAGRGGGSLTPGRHIRVENELPMTNLYLSLLDRVNVQAQRIGDSTGKLDIIG
jgi:hypothetical protein